MSTANIIKQIIIQKFNSKYHEQTEETCNGIRIITLAEIYE